MQNHNIKAQLQNDTPPPKKIWIKILKILGGFLIFSVLLELLPKEPPILYNTLILSVSFGLFFYILAYSLYFPPFQERWRKNTFENWFLQKRIAEFINYLSLKKISFQLINSKKQTYEFTYQNRKIRLDYQFQPFAGGKIQPGGLGSTNWKFYERFSHFFELTFQTTDLQNTSFSISQTDRNPLPKDPKMKDLTEKLKPRLKKLGLLDLSLSCEKGKVSFSLYDKINRCQTKPETYLCYLTNQAKNTDLNADLYALFLEKLETEEKNNQRDFNSKEAFALRTKTFNNFEQLLDIIFQYF